MRVLFLVIFLMNSSFGNEEFRNYYQMSFETFLSKYTSHFSGSGNNISEITIPPLLKSELLSISLSSTGKRVFGKLIEKDEKLNVVELNEPVLIFEWYGYTVSYTQDINLWYKQRDEAGMIQARSNLKDIPLRYTYYNLNDLY